MHEDTNGLKSEAFSYTLKTTSVAKKQVGNSMIAVSALSRNRHVGRANPCPLRHE